MSAALGELRAAVCVDELKRAWNAVQAGQFRTPLGSRHQLRDTRRTGSATRSWEPSTNEQVVPVLGCAGSCGASTLAVALATAAAVPTRVIECSSAAASGLAAASTAELGRHPSGWVHGTRGGVLLERTGDVLGGVDEVPIPSTPTRQIDLTLLDVGWELGQVLANASWLCDQVRRGDPVLLVTSATVPGLRRLEAAIGLLSGTTVVTAVVGPRRRKWSRSVEHSTGPLTRALDRGGRLIEVPHDRDLAAAGLDATPLPTVLLDVATHLLGSLRPVITKGKPR